MPYYSHYYTNIIGLSLVFEAGDVVGATAQKHIKIYKLSICCSTPEAIDCLDFKESKSKF